MRSKEDPKSGTSELLKRMRTLDRYIFRQMIIPVLGAVAALTAIALLSQSLTYVELVVERGQSAWTFMKVTLLSMPQLGGLIFPIAIFVGTLVALTRLQGEHEFTACFASGLPLMKLASPIIRIGVYFALISLASNLFLQPITARAMRHELFNIKNDLISTLIKEGDFSTSATGLTIYVQKIDQNGLLRQLFIRTPSNTGHDMTYAAKEGRIEKIDGSSILIMRQGSNQQIDANGQVAHYTWDETQVDITPYFQSDDYLQFKEGDDYMHELFFPNKVKGPTQVPEGKLIAEAHSRMSGPLFCIAFVLLALVSVLGGRFSRNGYAARIGVAAAVAAAIRIMGVVVQTAAQSMMIVNVLQYLVPLIPILVCLYLIRKADRGHRSITNVGSGSAFDGLGRTRGLQPLT